MSPVEQERYCAAIEPWAKRAERERKVITHVRYEHGHASAFLERRGKPEPVDLLL